jgi:hypothetical protein
MKVHPAGRSTVREGPAGPEVVIPARRNPFLLLFLPVWLTGWAFGELSVARDLLSGDAAKGNRLFLGVWLTFWTVGGVCALATWVWTAFGREIVALPPGLLAVRLDVHGLGYTREFDRAQVRNLRVVRPPRGPFVWRVGWDSGPNAEGTIAFDYGGTTKRFGVGLDEAEAALVIADLRTRHTFPGATP